MISLYKVDIDLSKSLAEIVKKTNGDREKEIYYFYSREKIFEHIARAAIKQSSEIFKFVDEERRNSMKEIEL